MSSTSKGNRLEDEFYQYLLDQQNRGELVFGAHPAANCRIFKKKKYYYPQREADVEFDVVIEVTRQGRESPYLYVVFECKNYRGNVPEIYVSDFSKKLENIFRNAVKGVIVVSSKLQSGAQKFALNNRISIVKYDDSGFETIADRKGRSVVESSFIEKQLFQINNTPKSLRFSAYYDGNYYHNVATLLNSFDQRFSANGGTESKNGLLSIPYVSAERIKFAAQEILDRIGYIDGPVDLQKVCSTLSIELRFTGKEVLDTDGIQILGSANFDRNLILINNHKDKNRENFTIGHEIGHFCMRHNSYLHSENLIEKDLLINDEKDHTFNLERLESQANAFSSSLLLPDESFKNKVAEYRCILDIRDRGHGYIFVDDQPCNDRPYHQLLSHLSTYFEVSKQAIEIKLKKLGMVTDIRKRKDISSLLPTF